MKHVGPQTRQSATPLNINRMTQKSATFLTHLTAILNQPIATRVSRRVLRGDDLDGHLLVSIPPSGRAPSGQARVNRFLASSVALAATAAVASDPRTRSSTWGFALTLLDPLPRCLVAGHPWSCKRGTCHCQPPPPPLPPCGGSLTMSSRTLIDVLSNLVDVLSN